MIGDALARQALDEMMRAGATSAQCRLVELDKKELNAEWNEPSLLRSTFENRLELVAIVDGRKGVVSSSETSPSGIQRAAAEAVEFARASRPDPAHAIAEAQPAASFESGPSEASLDGMADRLDELLAHRAKNHPRTMMRAVYIDFTRCSTAVFNSNGVDLRSSTGAYTFVATFSARQGADTSSFNYTVAHTRDLNRPIAELGSFDRLMGQAAEQLHPRKLPEKFVGDLVVTPDCLGSFLNPLASYLSDNALITKTSVYRDRLGQSVADTALSLHSRPRAETIAAPSFFTDDGYLSQDTTVIDRGVLKSFLLSQYGARKTGLHRAATDGGSWVVDPGETPLDELIGSVERGVLICRFSGGRPSASGDFSGIAKNSYLIENGRVGPALSETMVSGNLVRLVESIGGISREQVDFGDTRLPWVRLRGVTVS